MTTTKPQTLITTPAAASLCEDCETVGIRYPGDVNTYPHCPVCGSTSLVDTRSPWQVLAEAKRLAADTTVAVETRLDRQDTAWRVEAIAKGYSRGHCSDCRRFAPLSA